MFLLIAAAVVVVVLVCAFAWRQVPRAVPNPDAAVPDETGLAERGLGILALYFALIVAGVFLLYELYEYLYPA
jgi:hypothetical protein